MKNLALVKSTLSPGSRTARDGENTQTNKHLPKKLHFATNLNYREENRKQTQGSIPQASCPLQSWSSACPAYSERE